MIDGRLRIPQSVKAGEPFEVRVLILHPMENGFRHDAGGREIPMHIVNRVACTYGGREVFSVDLGTGISANPYLVFFVRAGQAGELKVEWVDDKGERGSASGIEYQSDAVKAMQADSFGNPGLLWVDRGAELWKQNCTGCHGDIASMKGAAARYPRHSPQLGRVVDLEQRIQACMPGLAWESRDLLGLTALVAHQSNGMPISVDVSGPAASTYEHGRSLYFERQGQLNLACTNCHDANAGKTLLSEPISQGQPADWPAYRLEWQSLGSLQRRLRACYFGVRAEMPAFGSDDLVALELYLANRAKGLKASVPGVRR